MTYAKRSHFDKTTFEPANPPDCPAEVGIKNPDNNVVMFDSQLQGYYEPAFRPNKNVLTLGSNGQLF